LQPGNETHAKIEPTAVAADEGDLSADRNPAAQGTRRSN
jgi:hypothetical protein